MNSKGHLYLSLIKSAIRILACIGAYVNIIVLPIGFGVAEILGIAEEIFDER